MDLQIALIAFGIAIIVAVYWLSVRRQKVNGQSEDDTLVQDQGFNRQSVDADYGEDYVPLQITPEYGQRDEQHAPTLSLTEETEAEQHMPGFLYNDDDDDDEKENGPYHWGNDATEQDDAQLGESDEGELEDSLDNRDDQFDDSDAITAPLDYAADDGIETEHKWSDKNDLMNNRVEQTQQKSDIQKPEQNQQLHTQRKTQRQTQRETQEPVAAAVSDTEKPAFTYMASQGFEKLSQLDYWVKLQGSRSVGRESVLGIYREHARKIKLPLRLYGLRVSDKIWAEVEHEPEGARFLDLVVTIQLANAVMNVDSQQMNLFSLMIEDLALKTARDFTQMAPVDSALQQAQSLSEFRDCYDKVYIVNVRPIEGDQFGGAAVDRCALQLGLEKGLHHYVRHKLIGRQKIKVFSVANKSETGEFDFTDIGMDIIKGITFFMQPAVNRCAAAIYAEMVDTSKSFASRIQGEVYSPLIHNLSIYDVEKIRRDIDALTKEMQQHGIAAGSDEAIRLFSL